MGRKFYTLMSIAAAISLLAACGNARAGEKETAKETVKIESHHASSDVIAAHEGLNQKPVPLKMERIGPHDVKIEMTAQVTDIEIDKGKIYKAWTFNGPLIVVNEGDTLHFTLKNMDPAMPHSMDFHAVHASPSKDFADVMPNKSGTFTYPANNPGVFMYHCGTKPVLAHIANGMHGMIIVKPKNGYPTDKEVDREFVLIQNEWYKYNDMDDFQNGVPSYVVFSTKALKAGDRNTNGDTFTLKEKPLVAKVGDKVRIYIENVGPNEVSSFHVVGTVLDDVYIDGNPNNHLKGLQTVMLPASGGAVVEFTVTRPGSYSIVSHQFNQAQKGAVAILKVTETGEDDGAETNGH
jgi:nitrite reductase (NO-forming)